VSRGLVKAESAQPWPRGYAARAHPEATAVSIELFRPPAHLAWGCEVPLGQEAPAVAAEGCLSDCLETAHNFTRLWEPADALFEAPLERRYLHAKGAALHAGGRPCMQDRPGDHGLPARDRPRRRRRPWRPTRKITAISGVKWGLKIAGRTPPHGFSEACQNPRYRNFWLTIIAVFSAIFWSRSVAL